MSSRPLLLVAAALAFVALARLRRADESARARTRRDAAAGLPAQRRPHRHLHGGRARLRQRARRRTCASASRSDSTDAVKLLVSGRAELAILDIHDLALARERGRDLVGVMALVQTPLAAILAAAVASARRATSRAGASASRGLPSDDAVLRSIVAGAGGDPAKVRRTTIGFSAVRSLLTGRVAAATGFWNVEGVALRARRPEIREFRVDDYGAPAVPRARAQR